MQLHVVHTIIAVSGVLLQSAMGYMPGRGLGKLGTGIAQPIEESMHKGRRGLGYLLDGLEREDVKWELEEVSTRIGPV